MPKLIYWLKLCSLETQFGQCYGEKKKVFEKIVPFSNYIYAHRVHTAGACQRFGGALGYRNSFEIVWEN